MGVDLMTVKELIQLNQMITDVEITVRKDGKLLDQLNIGPAEGVRPPYPQKVPVDERYIDANGIHTHTHKEATYIPKSINAWDDGKDYWNIKTDRIPKKWLELEVTDWDSFPATTIGTTSPRRGGKWKNVNFHGERIRINVLANGETLTVQEETKKDPKQDDQIPGQMSFEDLEADE